jgi:hypothetical protein
MERVRHSWSGKKIEELSSRLRSQGFEVKESKLPKPELRIAFRERVEVSAENCTASLDSYIARLVCRGNPTERDRALEKIIEEEYTHSYSFEAAVIYPAVLVFAAAMALSYLR